MLLIVLAIGLTLWAALVAVIVCLCISAARGDRDGVRQRHRAGASRAPYIRLIAHR